MWTSWTACSLSCGGGSQTHTRECNNPKPNYGGMNCSGNAIETKSCNNQSCLPGNVMNFLFKKIIAFSYLISVLPNINYK